MATELTPRAKETLAHEILKGMERCDKCSQSIPIPRSICDVVVCSTCNPKLAYLQRR